MNPALMKNAIDHEPQKLNPEYEVKILWRNAIFFAITNCILIRYVWFWLIETSWTIHFYVWLMLPLYAAGVTCGAHRLWAHRAYKGNTPYRFLMMILQTMGSQGHIYGWVRNHRLHHKYTDTDADPHNSTRGFFFCHMGWLMVAKHPEVLRKGKSIDMSDLERDWIVMWQKKYASILMPFIAFFIPTLIPMYLGNLSLKDAFGICIGLWQTVLHATWSVNSAAHMWGNKPYDSSVSAVQNVFVSLVAHGEGWHNYHHAFPQDYKAAEIPYFVNVSTAVIDFFSIFGWTYDLTTTKPELIAKRALRTGDGTHSPVLKALDIGTPLPANAPQLENNKIHPKYDSHFIRIWGWNDPDLPEEHRKHAETLHSEKLQEHKATSNRRYQKHSDFETMGITISL